MNVEKKKWVPTPLTGVAIPSLLTAPLFLLGLASLLSIGVYALIFMRAAPLLSLFNRPLLDLRVLSQGSTSIRMDLVLGYVALAALYAAGGWAARRANGRLAWGIVLGGALVAGAFLLLQYPYDAADIFDNIMHGRILGMYAANPFFQVGSNFKADPFYPYMAWPSSPSAYGPLWELMAGGLARLTGNSILVNTLAFKLLPGAFLAGSVALVALLLHDVAPERALSGVWLLAWNPLVLVETLGDGHNDAAMVFFILAAVLALARKRYVWAVLAIVAGGLVKFIPVLLLPAVMWIALRDLPGRRPRARFLLLAGAGGLLLVAALYAPFWKGFSTLGINRHTSMFTSSLPSMIYYTVLPQLGAQTAGKVVSLSAAGLTAVFALWMAFRYGKQRGPDAEAPWLRFTRASIGILLFYLLVTCPWFQHWYAVWPVGLAVLLPDRALMGLILGISFLVLAKPMILAPPLLWTRPLPPVSWRELRLSSGLMVLPWLGSAALLLRRKWI